MILPSHAKSQTRLKQHQLLAKSVRKTALHPLEINLIRESEYRGTISVAADDSIRAVQCSIAESKQGTDSANKVTLKLKGVEPFQGPIRLVAKSTESGELQRAVQAVNNQPLWLSVTAEPN
jgi:hypothetical protein